MPVKLTRVGNSRALIVPKAILDRLHIGEEDDLTLIENTDGFTISVYDKDFEAQMKAAKKYTKKYRNALHALADK